MTKRWDSGLTGGAIRRGIVGLALLLECAGARAAGGASDVGPASSASSELPDRRPVTVALHSDSPELTLDAVRAAVEQELSLRTVPSDSKESFGSRGVLTITYRSASKELAISYSDVERGVITRIVPAPDQIADVSATAALVAVNLVRDQTAGLLKAPAPAPVPYPPPLPIATVSQAPAIPAPKPPAPYAFANASLFFPLATNVNAPDLRTNFDLNLLYGRIGQLDGLELGTVSTVSGDARGLQLALLMNWVGGRARAGQLSFVFNRGRSVEGLQTALVNRADDDAQGLQFGALNFAGYSAAKDASASVGGQLGALNFAGDISGIQVGLLNVAGHVKGMQLGLVNVADDVDGAPIGLISVTRTGGVHPVIWTSNTTFGNLGVKFATRYTYTMLSGAVHSDGDRALYGGGLTIGTSIPVARRTGIEIDFQGLHLFANTACCRDRFVGAIARQYDQSLGKLRASVRFEWLKHLSLFAGTGVTGKVTYPLLRGDTEVRLTLVPELFGGVQL